MTDDAAGEIIATIRREIEEAADIMLTSTWVDVIGRVGAANPKDATIEQLTAWTLRDLAEVAEADNLWLLLPAIGTHRDRGRRR